MKQQLPDIAGSSPDCDCIPEYIELLWDMLTFEEKIKWVQTHIKHQLALEFGATK